MLEDKTVKTLNNPASNLVLEAYKISAICRSILTNRIPLEKSDIDEVNNRLRSLEMAIGTTCPKDRRQELSDIMSATDDFDDEESYQADLRDGNPDALENESNQPEKE